MAFYNSWELSGVKQVVQIIMERVSVKERELCVKRETTVGKVTLLTRIFERGTDFICRHHHLLVNGGILVLQKFFSEELSEQYRIMGRGARQRDKGSYRMILLGIQLRTRPDAFWFNKYLYGEKYKTVVYEEKDDDTTSFVELPVIIAFFLSYRKKPQEWAAILLRSTQKAKEKK